MAHSSTASAQAARSVRTPAHARSRADAPDRDPERLVGAYADMILRLSYTYLHNTADAEDICQEVLIKLIGRAQPFASLEHERAWVIRVTANAAKDLLRRQQTRAAVPLDAVPEVPAPADPDPAAHASERDRDQRVLAAVMSLPIPYREAIYLRYYEGYGLRGIASITGASEDAVAQRLSRARKQLRTILEGADHV